MESNHDFARSLALLRKEKGVSQRIAAKELGISQALLSHYENGAREPGLLFVRKACDYYHVSADFLLGRSMSREGATITADELYDASAEKGNTLRGSIAATLNKKLLVNSLDLLFDLLGKVGSREAITAASNYLSDAVYKMFRHLYRAGGTQNEGFFSIPANHFLAGCTDADMTYSEADYLDALSLQAKEKGKDSFPPMNNDALAQGYPAACQSLLQIVHNTGERVNRAVEGRKK
ncbi:MAG: helix-turn-helix transcriptional regulator [Oscillospiraceae bacterium]|nr:helix-turn-helix transcriptional regulator [Oscillospiraceae bacterium]